MIFENITLSIIFLFIISVLLVFGYYQNKSNAIFSENNFNPNFLNSLFKDGNFQFIRFKKILIYLSFFMLAFSISGLKMGTTVRPVERKGIDIIFCIDVSKSMDAEDINPSRIDKVKFEINKIINELSGDRIGIVVFSGSNFLYLPLTMDYDAAKLFVKSIDTDMISLNGTAIAQALDTSINSLSKDDKQEKMIFLFSDGEDHSNDSIEAIKSQLTDDVTIHVIGIGSVAGSLIPVSTAESKAFLKDSSGELVMTKLDEKFLINISEIGKGNFLRVSGNESVSDPIINIINTGEESLISSYEFSDYDYKYQYPLFFAILFLFVSYILPTGNRRI
tara:strand:- start:2266 stop:3267 length:1002 start_codon:yes stop_codon:yes gene_type:complete